MNNLIIEATKTAVEEIKKIMEKQDADDKAIRVNVSGFGWGGPQLGLVLDEQRENDHSQEIDGVTFLAGEDLKHFDGFQIDYTNSFLRKGFVVSPKGMPASSC